MNIERTAAPSASRPEDLTLLDMVNLQQRLSPDMLDMIARTFAASAARLRAAGFSTVGGRA